MFFLFMSDKNSGCYDNIFSIDFKWEKWKLTIVSVLTGIFGKINTVLSV